MGSDEIQYTLGFIYSQLYRVYYCTLEQDLLPMYTVTVH